jgi:hypothetical protein
LKRNVCLDSGKKAKKEEVERTHEGANKVKEEERNFELLVFAWLGVGGREWES